MIYFIPAKEKAALDVSREGLGPAINHADDCIGRNAKGTLDGDYWREVMRELISLVPEEK